MTNRLFALSTLSPMQLLGIWTELMECEFGRNGFGSTVAEIYTYRLLPRDPFYMGETKKEDQVLASATANQALYEICRLFERERGVRLCMYDVISYSDEAPLSRLVADPAKPFHHRVHIGLTRKNDVV